jgi:D-aspartate ligase
MALRMGFEHDPKECGVMSSAATKGRLGGVVIGGDFQGLGIVRSLGRRGVDVCVIDDERSIARRSRYCTHFVPADNLLDEPSAVDQLLDAGRRLGLDGWVLFPTRDETVAAISRHRDVLGETYRVPTPEWSRIQWAWDKRNTYRLAEKTGVPHPRTVRVEAERDLESVDLSFPVVIKPAVKEHFLYATKAKAWRADNRSELRALYRRACAVAPSEEIMLQELIPGDGRYQFAYCAFFKGGEAIGSMTVRRRRQHPPEFGRASTYVETVEEPVLERQAKRVLREIDYYGLVELEHKLDERDGQFKLLDFNARTWGYHTLGPAAGVDFPWLQFVDAVDGDAPRCRARPGMSWIRLVTDVPTALLEIGQGRLSPKAYLQSLVRADTEAVFNLRDPMPGLYELLLVPYLVRRRGF